MTTPTSTWFNIVLVRNGTTVLTYENGSLVGTDTISSSAALSPGNLFFGQRQSGNERVNGQLDEYAFWDTALSASDVNIIYTKGTTGLLPEPSSVALLGVAGAAVLRRRKRAKLG